MFEVIIISCADRIDAYLEREISCLGVNALLVGGGETFYKAVILDTLIFTFPKPQVSAHRIKQEWKFQVLRQVLT